MKSKTRILWINWHAYLSCFFLPFALLYAVSGVLYLFDIKGGAATREEFTFISPEPAMEIFPEDQEQAGQFVSMLSGEYPEHTARFSDLPSSYFHSGDVQGWYDFNREIIMMIRDGNIVIVEEYNDVIRKMLYIHKGIAGQLFVVLGILLGTSLLFSLISGTVVALVMPRMKNNALITIAAGSGALIIAWLIT